MIPRLIPWFNFLMQNCIGAIDGTHIPITIAQEKAPPYRNRKGTLSQNVMCTGDFDLKFTLEQLVHVLVSMVVRMIQLWQFMLLVFSVWII